MGLVSLFVRIALGGYLAWRGVRYVDPYARPAAIATARSSGWRGSDLSLVMMGLMMLIGGICIVVGIAPAAGALAAFMALAIEAIVLRKRVPEVVTAATSRAGRIR